MELDESSMPRNQGNSGPGTVQNVASVTSNVVDGQLPPALNVQKSTSGRHHLARLALGRAEVKASEPSVEAAMEKVTSSGSCGKTNTSRHQTRFLQAITRFEARAISFQPHQLFSSSNPPAKGRPRSHANEHI
eukprot:CAMPEP_0173078800 /NCGR_PEP_ID=MMETSP1102-20130122/14499_1 /TAXON_ID=49646 /ORGANISM="Geminigera sp., Strain Caron Lab Isolate" /LENGTH=132 /DNA_ID=CAMNT_0013950471 /DNA_START=851 /DNA_END=1249 /DNA_ORIENTATION=+